MREALIYIIQYSYDFFKVPVLLYLLVLTNIKINFIGDIALVKIFNQFTVS